MQYSELVAKARDFNLSTAEYKGSEITLVRAIQKSRSEEPCFMTTERMLCKKLDCEWRDDCRKLVAVWRR